MCRYGPKGGDNMERRSIFSHPILIEKNVPEAFIGEQISRATLVAAATTVGRPKPHYSFALMNRKRPIKVYVVMSLTVLGDSNDARSIETTPISGSSVSIEDALGSSDKNFTMKK